MQNHLVETPCGAVRGAACEGGSVFKGIRYARAGRWEYPRQVTSWEGEYQALEFGAACYQPRCFRDEMAVPEKAFYAREFRAGEHYEYSEDCLFLNIWVPEGAQNAPVLFYIHGGGFTGGCGYEKHFSGESYCAQGVITVTINYRLGPLGFFCLPELTERDGRCGNYALFDQLTALQWVHDNIAAFGGNPDRITMMGQSAGAMSVQMLSCSPLTRGLVCGAIMLSGGGVNKLLDVTATPESKYESDRALWQASGAASFEELLALPADQLFEAWWAAKAAQKKGAGGMGPVVDGTLLPQSPLAIADKGEQLNVPYLLGSTREDMFPPIMHSVSVKWALRQNQQNKQPSYVYFFGRQLPGDNKGAWHSSDLWYAFGTLKNCWRPFETLDYDISDAMVRYISAFVKSGVPAAEGLPAWPAISAGQRKVMCFTDKGIALGKPPKAKLWWNMTKKPVGE